MLFGPRKLIHSRVLQTPFPQLTPRKLPFENTEDSPAINRNCLVCTNHMSLGHIEARWFVTSFEGGRKVLHQALKPNAIQLTQDCRRSYPLLCFPALFFLRIVPSASRAELNLAEASCSRVHIKRRPTVGAHADRNFTSVSGAKAPYLAIAKESISLHKPQHVELDMIANNTVGPDDTRGFAVHVIPRAAQLRSQPPAQRPKVLSKPLAVRMRSAHAFCFRKKFIRTMGAMPATFLPVAAVARFFANDFVHI